MNKLIYKIIIFSLLFTPVVDADFFDDDGNAVIIITIKDCLFHGQIYESHNNTNTICSFNTSLLPSINTSDEYHHRDIPHNPECFGENHRSTPLRL